MNLPTHHRYIVERAQVDITLRLLKLRARTQTIRYCTGLSNDRIRRIYCDYGTIVNVTKRANKRGKSSVCTRIFTDTDLHRLESTSLAMIFVHAGLFKINQHALTAVCMINKLDFGHRLCCAYETYRELYANPKLSIEHARLMFNDIAENNTLALGHCSQCQTFHLYNLLMAEPINTCAVCLLLGRD
ncbi:MAG: hypothetical protein HKM24_02690 [Gammaproteobacteria bacterium]|nr:hypothetical protein [Gammaproteobacteria bacterium]